MSCDREPSDVYSAHVGETAEVRYRWHPAYEQKIIVVYRETRSSGSVAICQMPDGSCATLPVWMLDAAICACMREGPPQVSLAAIRDLRDTLRALGFDRPVAPVHEAQREESAHATEGKKVAANRTSDRYGVLVRRDCSESERPGARATQKRGSTSPGRSHKKRNLQSCGGKR